MSRKPANYQLTVAFDTPPLLGLLAHAYENCFDIDFCSPYRDSSFETSFWIPRSLALLERGLAAISS